MGPKQLLIFVELKCFSVSSLFLQLFFLGIQMDEEIHPICENEEQETQEDDLKTTNYFN